MKLFVAGIPNDFDDTDFREMFELYGTVSSAKIVMDRATGRKKGFGFVEMDDNEEARQAMHILDGTRIRGKALAVKEAGEQQAGNDNRDNNRRRSGGYGGGGYGGGYNNNRPGGRR
jgi:RNA recognition motif-containing protein